MEDKKRSELSDEALDDVSGGDWIDDQVNKREEDHEWWLKNKDTGGAMVKYHGSDITETYINQRRTDIP